jgi:hypothetical protein
MSAAATQVSLPLYEEATSYWEDLTRECEQQIAAINSVASANEVAEDERLIWRPNGDRLSIVRENFPSTEVNLSLAFEQWGPKICGSVRGYEEDECSFYPEEFEFALGLDPDQGTVAITGEGLGLCARELAAYVAQQFRRSFPGLSLPCPGC